MYLCYIRLKCKDFIIVGFVIQIVHVVKYWVHLHTSPLQTGDGLSKLKITLMYVLIRFRWAVDWDSVYGIFSPDLPYAWITPYSAVIVLRTHPESRCLMFKIKIQPSIFHAHPFLTQRSLAMFWCIHFISPSILLLTLPNTFNLIVCTGSETVPLTY